MSNVLLEKFGVRRIIGKSRERLCGECGLRAGLHYGSDCPKVDTETGKPYEKNEELIAWVKKIRMEE